MPKIPNKGETVKLICDTCTRLFEFTGDGDGWIPTTCPKCRRGKSRWAAWDFDTLESIEAVNREA